MKNNALTIPVAALALALSSFSAEAYQRGGDPAARNAQRSERRNSSTQARDRERPRADGAAQQRSNPSNRGGDRTVRNGRDNSNSGSDDQAQTRQRPHAPAPQRSDQSNRGGDRTVRNGRDNRNSGSDDQTQTRQRPDAPTQQRSDQSNRGSVNPTRNGQRNSGAVERNQRNGSRDSRDFGRNSGRSAGRGNDRVTRDHRGGYVYNRPRYLPYRSTRHYYGAGGFRSLYFYLGSGYRYGSPYSGRVYGYRAPIYGYSTRRYYGDVRLKVSPRDASVYVDGYYAGIVDDFDGFFQRLTLEVGPHEIEIEAPGLESQVFDVHVDPDHTINVHADLLIRRR